MSDVAIVLPYPPTVNHYWDTITRRDKKTGRKVYGKRISERGKAFRREVYLRCIAQQVHQLNILQRINAELLIWYPDRRKRDGDNLHKALWDALQHAGVFADDTQIRGRQEYDMGIVRGGAVAVRLTEYIPPTLPEWAQQITEIQQWQTPKTPQR